MKIYKLSSNYERYPIYEQLREYLWYCQYTRQMTQQTMRGKSYILVRFITDTGITDITEVNNHHINHWIAIQSRDNVSARTINTRLAHILSALRYYRDMGYEIPLKLPLVRKLKTGAVRRVFYTREEIDRVLSYTNDMQWLMIRICFDGGLRLSELTNLTIDNFHGQMIKFIGKDNKPRESYIASDTYARLLRYIENNSITNRLWIWGNNHSYSSNEVRIIMRRAFTDAGFDNFYPHALRHSFATDIQSKGATLLEMQQMLGHSNAQTTERYIHGLDGQLANLFDKYKNEPVASA